MRELFKILLQELKPHRRIIIFCGFLAIVAALLETFAPIVLGRGFDYANAGRAFFIYGGALAGWFTLRTVAERTRTYITKRGMDISTEVGMRRYLSLMQQIMDKPLSFHYGKKRHEISEKLHEFRWNIDSLIETIIFDFAPAILGILAILVYLATLEWRIALMLLISIVILIVYTYRISIIWTEKRNELFTAEHDMSATAWNGVQNILVVKSTTHEGTWRTTLEKLFNNLMRLTRVFDHTNAQLNNGQNIIITTGSLAVLLIAVENFKSGIFTFGQLTTVTAYIFSVYGYVRFTQWQFRSLLDATTAWGQIKEALAEPPEDFTGGRTVEITGDIEFRNVRFRYRKDKSTIEDVSFYVTRGQRVAIVGESGEGKTTLVELLGRYYMPQSGKILFDDINIHDINLISLRSQLAYVPQDLTLFHDTLAANIRVGRPDASEAAVHEAARLAHLEEFIAGLPEKYATMVGERGLKLSAGERQRVAIARAFLRNPKILILDEPTAHLDSKTEEFIQNSLEHLMAGRTTFIIAHRLRTVRNANIILVLKDGRIVEQGTHDELARKPNGTYAALLRAQTEWIGIEEHASPNE